MRSHGTAKELEARRRPAVQPVANGWTQRQAAFLGVHPVTVGKWAARHWAAGDAGPAATPTRFLTADREAEALGWPADPPTRPGYRTDLWTARRVAELVRARMGVACHPHYLREWLAKRTARPRSRPAAPASRPPAWSTGG